MMNKNKLKKLKRELESLRGRKGNFNSTEVIQFAMRCGREKKSGKQGKEPTYISIYLPYRRPLSIPNHPGNISKGTAGSILDDLEQDLFEIEEMLDQE